MSEVLDAPADAEATPGQQTIDGGEGAAPYPQEIRVDGTAQLGLIDFGGKQPQSASITFVGGRVKLVDGKGYRKGDTIRFEGTAVVRAVAAEDTVDSETGIVVSAEQKHKARIVDLLVYPAG